MYRRWLKHSPVKNIFRFASVKMSVGIAVESSLEFDTCFHLEYSREIASFEAQPEGFHCNLEGKLLPGCDKNPLPELRINIGGDDQFALCSMDIKRRGELFACGCPGI